MIKNKTFIEIEVKGRDYIFVCSPDSPLQDAHEAVKLIEKYLMERLQATQDCAPQEPAEVKEEINE